MIQRIFFPCILLLSLAVHTADFAADPFASSWVATKIRADKSAGKKIWLRFGLSANPIHLGHLEYLSAVMQKINADETSIVPAKLNPFKGGVPQGSVEQKKEMMQAALKDLQNIAVSTSKIIIDTQELDRAGERSFTWETIQNVHEHATAHEAEIFVLLTNESVEEFYLWEHPLSIVDNATIVYGHRPGTVFDKTLLLNKMRKIDEIANSAQATTANDISISVKNGDDEMVQLVIPSSKIRHVHEKVIAALDNGYIPVSGTKIISSTDIRRAIEEDRDIGELVGKNVAKVISAHYLYQH